MKLNYYYSPESTFKSNINYSTIHANVLLSDSLMYGVDKSWADLLLEDIDKWPKEKLFERYKYIFRNDDRMLPLWPTLESIFAEAKIINPIKHKTKDMLVRLSRFKVMINMFKQELLIHRTGLLEHNQVTELWPFVDEGIWKLTLIDFEDKANQQDVLISEISHALVERTNILSFDRCIESLFVCSSFDSPETETCDIIKIPLWDLPFFHSLSYKQLKYTRDDLKPALQSFKLKLKELSEEIFSIPFLPENQLIIKQLCRNKFDLLIAGVQQSINDSLYISQIKNSSAGNNGLKFCMGIATAETLINYFEKTKTVVPYVSDEIKQQTARHIDLKSSYVFIWFEVLMDQSADVITVR